MLCFCCVLSTNDFHVHTSLYATNGEGTAMSIAKCEKTFALYWCKEIARFTNKHPGGTNTLTMAFLCKYPWNCPNQTAGTAYAYTNSLLVSRKISMYNKPNTWHTCIYIDYNIRSLNISSIYITTK